MKCKINGWDILESELENAAGKEEIIAEVFGEGFEISTLASGDYLLNCEEVGELLNKLELPQKSRIAFLDSLITGRIRYDISVGIDEFQKLFRQNVRASENQIPCMELEKLSEFNPQEDLYQFVSNRSEEFLQMDLPAGSCALKVSGNIIQSLPENSVVIVNSAKAADSMLLIRDANGNFSLQNNLPANTAWYINVLQINFVYVK